MTSLKIQSKVVRAAMLTAIDPALSFTDLSSVNGDNLDTRQQAKSDNTSSDSQCCKTVEFTVEATYELVREEPREFL